MFDFRHAPLTFFIPWPFLVLMLIGVAAIGSGLVFGFLWFVSHLQWVNP